MRTSPTGEQLSRQVIISMRLQHSLFIHLLVVACLTLIIVLWSLDPYQISISPLSSSTSTTLSSIVTNVRSTLSRVASSSPLRSRARLARPSRMADAASGGDGTETKVQQPLARHRQGQEGARARSGWFPLGYKEGFSQWVSLRHTRCKVMDADCIPVGKYFACSGRAQSSVIYTTPAATSNTDANRQSCRLRRDNGSSSGRECHRRPFQIHVTIKGHVGLRSVRTKEVAIEFGQIIRQRPRYKRVFH